MAFTTITSGLDWQDADFINEFRNATNERSQAFGGSSYNNTSTGTDIQDKAYWLVFQNWLETNCVNFVDHNATIVGESDVPMFTISTWRAEAGLNVSGFRRATAWVVGAVDGTWENDVTFSYGKMQAGDIIGPWIFEDLQKGYKALKWTTELMSSSEDEDRDALSTDTSTCALAISTQIDEWDDVSSWGTWSGNAYSAQVGTVSGGYAYGRRERGRPYLSGIYNSISHSMDIYMIPRGTSGAEYVDIDGLGMNDDELWFYETLSSTTTSTRAGTLFNPSNNSPVQEMPLTCPFEPGVYIYYIAARGVAVLKWSFTES